MTESSKQRMEELEDAMVQHWRENFIYWDAEKIEEMIRNHTNQNVESAKSLRGSLVLIEKLQAELKAKDELLRECEEALAFYGDENKWFMRTKIIDPSKDVIFASRYNDKTGQSEAVDIKKPFESKSFEVTARLKVDQGKTAQAMLEKLREGINDYSRGN